MSFLMIRTIKNLALLTMFTVCTVVAQNLNAQEDFRKQAPPPGDPRTIEIGDYESFTLDNGLRVIVVENHKIPRVSYQLFVDRDPVLWKERAGVRDIAGAILARGTKTRTKAEIDEAIDYVGGSLSTNDRGGFVSSLTRHSETVLEVFADVILNPSFPEEEFEKIRTQTISGLQVQKDNPDAIASNVSSVLVYGPDHPYGEVVTETTVGNITLEDLRTYYETFFRPNISYLVMVGDITVEQARARAKKYFGFWKKADVPKTEFSIPTPPQAKSVHFVDKAGAVQSVIRITHPVELKPGAPDAIPAAVMNTILGSGFSGRLFRNLREDKGYTYGAYSSLAPNELVGAFTASASVRNEVTDSSITEFLYELEQIRSTEVSDEELELAINFMAGNFARSLESPQTVANFALNTYRYNLPRDYYATYLERLSRVSKADVKAMAQKYVIPDRAHIIVVGNQDAVSEKLSVFDRQDGTVRYYDIYGKPRVLTAMDDIDIDGKDVIRAYIKAIGGEEKLNSVKSLSSESAMSMMGQEMSVQVYHLAPDKLNFTIGMPGMTIMRQVYDGEKGILEQMGQKQEAEGELLDQLKEQALMFPELLYLNDNYTVEVRGIEDLNGENAYRVVVTNPVKERTEYYSVDTGLKLRAVEVQDAGGQTATISTDYSDYRSVEGIMFPYLVKMSGMGPMPFEMAVQKIEVNKELDPALFSVN